MTALANAVIYVACIGLAICWVIGKLIGLDKRERK